MLSGLHDGETISVLGRGSERIGAWRGRLASPGSPANPDGTDVTYRLDGDGVETGSVPHQPPIRLVTWHR